MRRENERRTTEATAAALTSSGKPECFVIMPISDPSDYEDGHFQHIFEDIFVPACDAAGYTAVRADQVKETNLIHLDVLQRLVSSPMVLCDLSSRNPNVLFELGLRQAFDRPVVLTQEVGTPKIFDISPLRVTEYRRARVYHEVLEDQSKIASAIGATNEAATGQGVNSIVKLLSLTKATIPETQVSSRDPLFQVLRAELDTLRQEMRGMMHESAVRTGEILSRTLHLPISRVPTRPAANIPIANDFGYVRNRLPEILPPGLRPWNVELSPDNSAIVVDIANDNEIQRFVIKRNLTQEQIDLILGSEIAKVSQNIQSRAAAGSGN